MRIRRKPSFLLSSPPPPLQTPDLLTETRELQSNHPWRSQPADQQDSNTKASASRLLHSVEDPQLEANKFFNPDQSDQSSLSSFLDSKRDLTESHSQNPSVNTTQSSGAPPSPANKRRKRPALLMEGSRCSRVNGRGWRCSQPTLVGYSLCEHHLGKGRLRSMSSVKEKLEYTSPEIELRQKAKKKIGVVKARSLSSLLDDNIAGDMTLQPQLRRSGEREDN